jgi:hypothetical protein
MRVASLQFTSGLRRPLDLSTTDRVGILSNMAAIELLHTRVVYAETSFAELVLWRLPRPVAGSTHAYKYRLAYVVRGKCVLRYDNESGKGDHRHLRSRQSAYAFTTPEQLLADFMRDIERWNHDNRDA